MAPLPTRVTAALANASERRSIAFEYQQTPIYHKPVTVEAPLDEKGCLAIDLPFTEAQMVLVKLDDEVKLFLEPGDQLHLDADLLDLPQSLRFSGQGAANNQFLAALRARFPDYLRIDYEDLAVDAHRQIIDQRHLELESFLDEGCSQYQLTLGFIAYYRSAIIYEWAEEVFHYLIAYEMCNGRKRPVISEDYYDALNPVELIDEAAIGIIDYRRFLRNNFIRIMDEAEEQAAREQLSEEQRRAGIQPRTIAYLPDFIVQLDEEQRRGDFLQFHTIIYHLAKRLLHGKVLYFFLAGEIIDDFQDGRFDQGKQRWAEFRQDNPYPEYTEAVEEVVRETSKFKPGQPAPDFTLDDLQGQSVSLSDFRGQAVLLDFWSRGCLPCVEDFPYLEQIKQQTQDQKVVFLSISLDASADRWQQAVNEHGLTGVHVRSPGGWQAAVAQLYQIRSIPTYLLVGPDGLLAGRVNSVWNVADVVARIGEIASGEVPSSKSNRSEMVISG
ncbi:MAG: TlpA family protein disulfide reductase [Gemmatimonadetes bacterium]|nr:TlpA family protein disulfide reductase [Gemmatimonadota bacterium]